MSPLPLLPFQQTGADWLAGRERTGLFDEMGVGKTAQAIGALDRCGAERFVVVAPAAVREVWAGEVRKFSARERRVVKARTIHDLGYWLKGRAQGLLVSYEMAVKWADYLKDDVIDALIFDECHYLKNADTARTRSLLGKDCTGLNGLVANAAQTWWLSGTPIPNDPIDIWTFLRCSGHTPLTLAAFTKRYFKSYQGTYSSTQKPRDEMVPELQQILRVASLRRTMNDVGLELPPVFLTTSEVDGDTAEIRDLLRTYPGLESAILDAIEKGGLSFLDSTHIATLRRLVGESKAPAYGALLVEEFRNGLDQMVVFGFHTRALEIIVDCLQTAGIPCALLNGPTSETKRVQIVKDFQAGKIKCAVLNYKSGGTGITLTASAHLDMFESSWSPADNAQAIKRISRIGQTRNCRARFISLANSIDQRVTQRVSEKTAAIVRIVGS